MTQNAQTSFTFNTTPIRVVTIDGEPRFVLKDVCLALNGHVYSGKVNVSQVRKMLGDDEVRLEGVDRIHPSSFNPRVSTILLASESGLYKPIMRSDKPQAKPFQNWACRRGIASEAIRDTLEALAWYRAPNTPRNYLLLSAPLQFAYERGLARHDHFG